MATIGWIKVGVTADTSMLVAGMKRAEQAVAGFQKTMGTIKGALAGLGVALGAHALFASFKGIAAGAKEQKVMSERLGMSAEAYGKLSYAAKRSGVDQETFAGSVEKMNDRLAEVAITGEGPAADALKRFGISAKELVAMGPEQAFTRLIGVIHDIPNPMERANLAVDLFGKSGQAIVSMAAKGTEGLAALGARGLELGAVLDSVQTEKLKEANAAFGDINAAMTGVGNSIAIGVAPFITALTDQFIAMTSTGTTMGSYVAQGIDWITKAIGFAADAVQLWLTGFYTLRAGFTEVVSYMAAGIDKLIQAFGWLYEKITGTKLELTNFAKDFSELAHLAAKADFQKATDMSKAPWAHNAVRELADDIKGKAQQRAELKVGAAQQFAGGTTIAHAKVVEPKFAGAMELGSKESYSAIVNSKARLTSNLQNKIEANTAMTAAATVRTADAVSRMAQLAEQGGRGTEQGRAATANN